MHDFRQADGRKVAVALIPDDDTLRIRPFYSGSHRRCPPVSRLHIPHIKIVVREDGTAYRADKNRAVLDAHIRNGLGDQLVHHAVPAPGTVVRLVLQLRLALVLVVKNR